MSTEQGNGASAIDRMMEAIRESIWRELDESLDADLDLTISDKRRSAAELKG